MLDLEKNIKNNLDFVIGGSHIIESALLNLVENELKITLCIIDDALDKKIICFFGVKNDSILDAISLLNNKNIIISIKSISNSQLQNLNWEIHDTENEHLIFSCNSIDINCA